MINPVKTRGSFRYAEYGEGRVMLLLHGLFGALSNWKTVVDHFESHYRVIIPSLPLYDMPPHKANLENLLDFLESFCETLKLENLIMMGNSLGGHLAILQTLHNSKRVEKLILTGSSGLFESTAPSGLYPQRGSYEFVRDGVSNTFYDPSVASKELVDGVFEIVKSIPKLINTIRLARSAKKNNLAADLHQINIPTLLVWGLNDTITPPQVAHEFNVLIPRSQLFFIDRCCHVPMMEHPEKFNSLVDQFLTSAYDRQ